DTPEDAPPSRVVVQQFTGVQVVPAPKRLCQSDNALVCYWRRRCDWALKRSALKLNITPPRLTMTEAASSRVHGKPLPSRVAPPVLGKPPTAGVAVGAAGVAVPAAGVAVEPAGAPGQPRMVTLLVSIVTSPFRARALPGTMVAPV